MSSRHNGRRAALQALYQWDLTNQDVDQIEPSFKQIHDMQNIDRKYLREIMREVPRLKKELESTITPFIDREFDKLDPVERAILRIGTYELQYRRDVPTKVVLNEMIELAKVFGSEHSYKFINGVMDKLAGALRKSPVGRNSGGQSS
ncbi:MAG: transcription antitermination factor NusB [Arenicella sp.]|nr:transcription antitermination factor NusB [Arenicella sp.]